MMLSLTCATTVFAAEDAATESEWLGGRSDKTTKTSDKLYVENNGVKANFDEYGINMIVDGIPFSNHSQFHVKKSDWKHRFFSYELLRPLEETVVSPDHTKMVTHLVGTKSECYDGTQTLEALPDRTIRFTVEGEATSATRGVMQIFPFSVENDWFAGRSWRATLKDGSTTSGIFAFMPMHKDQNPTILPDFKEMVILSNLGDVKIRQSGSLPCVFGDYRGREIDSRMKFCCGIMGSFFKFPLKYNFTIEVQFAKSSDAPKYDMTAPEPLKIEEAVKAIPEAAKDVIIPTPKHCEWGANDAKLAMTSGMTVSVDVDDDTTFGDIDGPDGPDIKDAEEDALEASMRVMRDNFIDVVQQRSGVMLNAQNDDEDEAAIRFVCKPNVSVKPHQYDYYQIKVDAKGVLAESNTTGGLVCAAATLRQLMRPDAKAFRCATIEDWADMPVRGIHCFSGNGESARDIQTKVIRDIMGELKINAMIYECSYINWKSRSPRYYSLRGMDVELAKQVISAAAKEFVEIIPLVNTLGHCEWLLNYTSMTRLADDPSHPYAYDVTNPEVYEICEKVYDECIALFKPRAVHIGHDEVNLYNIYPMRPEAVKLGETQIVLNDVEHWYQFLKKRGMETWMWQDMLFHSSEVKGPANAPSVAEAQKRRDGINKDVVMVDWNYDPMEPEKFVGMGLESKAGFDNLSASWYNLNNITHFAQATVMNILNPAGTGKTRGMIHTTWAGYSYDAQSYFEERRQYSTYTWAAEQMWNGGKTVKGANITDVSKNMTRLMGENPIPSTTKPGFIVVLNTPEGVSGPKELGFVDAMKDQLWADRVRMDSKSEGVVIAGRTVAETGNDKNRGITKLECPINLTASYLSLTGAATAFAKADEVIANMTVEYADGSKQVVPLRMNREIATTSDMMDYPALNLVEFGKINENQNLILHTYTWTNPMPDKTIKSLVIESANHPSGYYLRAITGITK